MELDDLTIHINLDSVSGSGVAYLGTEIVGYWKMLKDPGTNISPRKVTISIGLDETFQRMPAHMVTPCKFTPVDMEAIIAKLPKMEPGIIGALNKHKSRNTSLERSELINPEEDEAKEKRIQEKIASEFNSLRDRLKKQ